MANESPSPAVRSRFRWEVWTLPRAALATSWLIGTFVAGASLLYPSLFAAGIIRDVDRPFPEPVRETALSALSWLFLSGVIIAGGPLGVWLLRRRRGWLLFGLAEALLICGYSVLVMVYVILG